MTDFFKQTAAIAGGTVGLLRLAEVWGAYYANHFSQTWPYYIRRTCVGNEIAVYERVRSDESQGCVLLVHGIGNSSVAMMRLGEEIEKRSGSPVIRYDRPGYGGSRFCTDEPYSVTQAVDELIEIIRSLYEKYNAVTVVGYSYGGLITYLALSLLEDPPWCDAVLIEPTHFQEAVGDPQRTLGISLGIEGLRNRLLLASLGGELLDASIGPKAADGRRYPYVDAVRRERRSGRCLRASKREFKTIAQLLFDGVFLCSPNTSPRVRVISSARSAQDPRQRDLFTSYADSPEGMIIVEGTSHDTIILDRHSVEQIARLVGGEHVNAA